MKDLQLNNQNKNRLMDSKTPPVSLLDRIDGFSALLSLEPLEEAQILAIANFIYFEFKTLTVDEITDAVYKANSGKLDGDCTAYGKIDIAYFGRILPAYKKYKAKKVLEERAKLKPIEDEGKLLGVDEKALKETEEQNCFEWVAEVYKKDGALPMIANWNACFNYMERTGLIDMDNDEKAMFMEIEIDSIKQQINDRRAKRLAFGDLSELLNFPVRLKHHCRKQIVQKYFLHQQTQ